MTYLGDFTYQDEVHHLFTTRDSTGQPSSLSGASIAVYEDDNIAQQTGSMTITVDFDSVTGLNHVIVDTDDTFYLPVGDVGRNCSCVLTAGAVDGVTVTGEVLFTFSVQARYGASLTAQQVRDALKLAPSGGAAAAGSTDDQLATAQTDLDTITGADGVNLLTATQASIDAIETDTNSLNDTKVPNTLNTTASGNIGIDWANVENPTTALDLSATDIQLVDTCTTNTDVRGTDSAATAAALTTAQNDLDIITGTNGVLIDDDAITAAKIATDAIGSDEFAASAAQKIRDEILPTQNVAFSNIEFLWVAASDHVTPVTGASGTAVTRSIDGGAFGSATGTLAEVGNGIYQFDASQADMNGGIITFRFTASGGTPGAPDDAFLTIVTGGGV